MTTGPPEETSSLLQQDNTSLEGGMPACLSTSPPPPSPSRWRAKLWHTRQLWVLYVVVVGLLVTLLSFVYRDHVTMDVFLTSDDFPVEWNCPAPLPSAPFPSSRVLILTTDDRPLPDTSDLPADVSLWPYYLLTHQLNTRYAAYHKYAYQRVTERMASARSIVWSKVYHVLHSVDWAAYDYVVAVDSDAWFTQLHYPLHDMLNCFSPDALPSSAVDTSAAAAAPLFAASAPDFIFSLDWPMEAINDRDLNAGVFIMRTTAGARAILQHWWQLADQPAYSHLQSGWPAEQGVLNQLLMNNQSVAASIRVMPRQVIYGHAAAYINHVTSFWPRQRGWKGRREQLIIRDIVRAAMLDRPQ